MNARRLRKLLRFWNGQKTNLGFGQFPPGRLLLPGASLDVDVSEWRGTLSVPPNLKLGLLHPPLASLLRHLFEDRSDLSEQRPYPRGTRG